MVLAMMLLRLVVELILAKEVPGEGLAFQLVLVIMRVNLQQLQDITGSREASQVCCSR